MIKWIKNKQNANIDALPEQKPEAPTEKLGVYTRLKNSLSKTRHQFTQGLSTLLLGKKTLDAALFEELETQLLTADLGMSLTKNILEKLQQNLARNQLADGEAAFEVLKEQLETILLPCSKPLSIENSNNFPFVILIVGINGAGKTTSIAKMAKQFQSQGKKVMLAAGDTFRAAAVEQLKIWGERTNIPVIAQPTGSDSASVIYDALQAAKARNVDVLIADTAGRLHTQHNLMEELKKIKRVIQKLDPNAPHETILVLDASIGQNALNQARDFHQALGITGMIMTKLDGTAKGGIIFAIANELALPYRYLGIGEGVDDLRPFDASQFVEALFTNDSLQTN